MRQRPGCEPLEKGVAVGRLQDLIQGIRPARWTAAARDGQQVQVVVAEHDDSVVPECAHVPQYLERLRATIDQITDEPQPVAVRREAYPAEKCSQLITAALDVADGMSAHCRIPGIASRKGGMGASKGCPSPSTIW